MIEKLDYAIVPNGFAHCFNCDCKNAGSCLRHQIARFIPDTRWSVAVVNPARTVPDGECEAFLPDIPLKNAVGMDQLLVKLPYDVAKAIKKELLNMYGKNKFYQFKRRERVFTPMDQEYIQKVFLCRGVKEEPVFDSWQTNYYWEKW